MKLFAWRACACTWGRTGSTRPPCCRSGRGTCAIRGKEEKRREKKKYIVNIRSTVRLHIYCKIVLLHVLHASMTSIILQYLLLQDREQITIIYRITSLRTPRKACLCRMLVCRTRPWHQMFAALHSGICPGRRGRPQGPGLCTAASCRQGLPTPPHLESQCQLVQNLQQLTDVCVEEHTWPQAIPLNNERVVRVVAIPHHTSNGAYLCSWVVFLLDPAVIDTDTEPLLALTHVRPYRRVYKVGAMGQTRV